MEGCEIVCIKNTKGCLDVLSSKSQFNPNTPLLLKKQGT